MNTLMIARALPALVLLSTPAWPQTNLVENGSFEQGLVAIGYTTLPSGSTDLTAWTVSDGGNVDLVGNSFAAADGLQSIDLDGSLPGGIEQSFVTVPGRLYEVSFDLAGNPNPDPSVKLMRVEVDDGAQFGNFEFDVNCLSPAAMGWKRARWSFTASDSTTTLVFRSLHEAGVSCTSCFYGAAIDDVVVMDTTQASCLYENYCEGAPNSAYCAGSRIGAAGSLAIADNTFVLTAALSVPNNPGIFYYGGGFLQLPFGEGFRCVADSGTGVFRLHPPVTSSSFGYATRAVDFTQTPAAGSITPGANWYFQYWYRDPNTVSGFNLSDGIRVMFCP